MADSVPVVLSIEVDGGFSPAVAGTRGRRRG
jgi:hypothetical protein